MLCLHFFLTLIKALYCLCAVPPRCGRPRNAERCRTFAAGTAVCVCLQPRCRSPALITCAWCHCKDILNGWGWDFGGFSGPSPSSTLRRPGDGPGADPARRALVHHHRTWSAADPDSSPFRHADTHQLALLSRLVMPALRLRVRGGPCGMRRAAHIETHARAPRGHKYAYKGEHILTHVFEQWAPWPWAMVTYGLPAWELTFCGKLSVSVDLNYVLYKHKKLIKIYKQKICTQMSKYTNKNYTYEWKKLYASIIMSKQNAEICKTKNS